SMSIDDYDPEIKVTQLGAYYVHHVQLKNLNPQTEYFFRVGNGLWSWDFNPSRQESLDEGFPTAGLFTFTTNNVLDEIPSPDPAYGRIYSMYRNDSGFLQENDSTDTIVYTKLVKGDGSNSSAILSSVTNDMGGWTVDKSNFRDVQGDLVKGYEKGVDKFVVFAQYENYDKVNINEFVLGVGDAPTDHILGNTWEDIEGEGDFKVKSSVVESRSWFDNLFTGEVSAIGVSEDNPEIDGGLYYRDNIQPPQNNTCNVFAINESCTYGFKLEGLCCVPDPNIKATQTLAGGEIKEYKIDKEGDCARTGAIGCAQPNCYCQVVSPEGVEVDWVPLDEDCRPASCANDREGEYISNGNIVYCPEGDGWEYNAQSGVCTKVEERVAGAGEEPDLPITEVTQVAVIGEKCDCEGTYETNYSGDLICTDQTSYFPVAGPIFSEAGPLLDGVQCTWQTTSTSVVNTATTNPETDCADGWKECIMKNKTICIPKEGISNIIFNNSAKCDTGLFFIKSDWENCEGNNYVLKSDGGCENYNYAKELKEPICCADSSFSGVAYGYYLSTKERGCHGRNDAPFYGYGDNNICKLSSFDIAVDIDNLTTSESICCYNKNTNTYSILKGKDCNDGETHLSRFKTCTEVFDLEQVYALNAEGKLFKIIKYIESEIPNDYVEIQENTDEIKISDLEYICATRSDTSKQEFILKDDINQKNNNNEYIYYSQTSFKYCIQDTTPTVIQLDRNGDIILNSSMQIPNNNLLINKIKAQTNENETTTEEYQAALYLPESGIYTLDLGEKQLDLFLRSDANYYFYEEVNGIDGFQIPTDPYNPKEGEDRIYNLAQSEVKLEKKSSIYEIKLTRGINIISFPFMPTKDGTNAMKASEFLEYINNQAVLDGYERGASTITYFDGGKWDGGYKIGSTDNRTNSGLDFDLLFGRGYLVVADRDMAVEIPGFEVKSEVPIAFGPGWNLVGVHGYTQAYTASSFIDSVSDIDGLTADNVTYWPTDKGAYQGLQKSGDAEYGFDFQIFNNVGYFVRISEYAPENKNSRTLIWNPGTDLHGKPGSAL
ncbi:MAG TPA: fibronectin type III domain-containing protein, partial [Candidatus Dojkabacteria bacterium]|nr:fibronectin type III domain-containing protein [Candidatus Dojkabacteria bacterium]